MKRRKRAQFHSREDIQKVRNNACSPPHAVPAGHDRFPMEFVTRYFREDGLSGLKGYLGADLMSALLQVDQNFPGLQEAARQGASLNMTQLALGLSHYVNRSPSSTGDFATDVSRADIEAITNGVHAGTGLRLRFERSGPDFLVRPRTVCAADRCRQRKSSGPLKRGESSPSMQPW